MSKSATAKAAELAKENDIVVDLIPGTGSGGRVLVADVEKAIAAKADRESNVDTSDGDDSQPPSADIPEAPDEDEEEEELVEEEEELVEEEDEELVEEEDEELVEEEEEDEDEEDAGEYPDPPPLSYWRQQGAASDDPAYLLNRQFTNRGGKRVVRLVKAPGRIPGSHNLGEDVFQIGVDRLYREWEHLLR